MKIKENLQILSLCSRCGKCVPVCPSYAVYRLEAFSPRGRIFLFSHGKKHESLDACLFCERCERVCPNGISFPRLYLESLKEKEEKILPKEFVKAFSDDPLLIFLKLNNWLKFIEIKEEPKVGVRNETANLTVFYSCGLKHLYPTALKNFAKVLEKRGISVKVPENLVCCGAIFLNLGIISLLRKNALKNLEILEKERGPIIFFCATCLWMFKKVYPQIFKGTAYEKRFVELSQKVVSAYFYLFSELKEEVKKLEKRSLSENILFHLPCHLTEEFSLVKNNLKVKEFCCGSPKASLWLKGFQEKNKKQWIKNLENKYILTTFCTGCFLNFNILLRKPPLVCHWLEFL